MPQTSTTGQLENASREMIAQLIYSTENNIVATKDVVEQFSLSSGEDTGIFPKVGKMSFSALAEGQDIIDEEDIGMTTVSVTPSEVGAKVILTDRLLRRNVATNWRSVGRQLGDAGARRENEDFVGLFSGLSTDLGSAGRILSGENFMNIITRAQEAPLGSDLSLVHHPVAVARLGRDVSSIGSGTIRPIPTGLSQDHLNRFWEFTLLNVKVYQTATITRDSSGDAIGAIFDRQAFGKLNEQGIRKERQRDASLRAWEMVVTSVYAYFEHDDDRGFGLTLDAAQLSTT